VGKSLSECCVAWLMVALGARCAVHVNAVLLLLLLMLLAADVVAADVGC
jgi:hypothetical protein